MYALSLFKLVFKNKIKGKISFLTIYFLKISRYISTLLGFFKEDNPCFMAWQRGKRHVYPIHRYIWYQIKIHLLGEKKKICSLKKRSKQILIILVNFIHAVLLSKTTNAHNTCVSWGTVAATVLACLETKQTIFVWTRSLEVATQLPTSALHQKRPGIDDRWAFTLVQTGQDRKLMFCIREIRRQIIVLVT